MNESTAHAKFLQQSASTSIILTNHALKMMYMVLNSLNLSFHDILRKICFGLFRGRGKCYAITPFTNDKSLPYFIEFKYIE